MCVLLFCTALLIFVSSRKFQRIFSYLWGFTTVSFRATSLLICINDFPLIIDGPVNINCQIKSPKDLNFLQSNLNKLVLYSNKNYLSFNNDKCKIITFSGSKIPYYYITIILFVIILLKDVIKRKI